MTEPARGFPWASSGPIRWLKYVWLVYVGFVFLVPFYSGRAVDWGVAVASVVVFLPLYFAAHADVTRNPRRSALSNAAIAALGFALFPFNFGGMTYLIFSAAHIGFIARPRLGALYLAALCTGIAIEGLMAPPGAQFYAFTFPTTLVIVIGSANLIVGEQQRHARRLSLARQDVEEVAKLAERERIGRDLHDLLGHTLSVIALKSELAAKLAEHDLPGAVQEIRDVERVSREALTEVRRAVEGYRQHGLKGELANAARALDAAGVALDAQLAAVTLPPRDETVLALSLREAITNVVRHAQASHCRVRLTADGAHTVLTVEDDGNGGVQHEGSGLSGMRTRVAEAGGTLDVAPGSGLRLTITLPVRPASTLP